MPITLCFKCFGDNAGIEFNDSNKNNQNSKNRTFAVWIAYIRHMTQHRIDDQKTKVLKELGTVYRAPTVGG